MTVLKDIIIGLLTDLLEKFAGAFRQWADTLRRQAAIKRAVDAEREATEAAKTEEERAHAADNNRRL